MVRTHFSPSILVLLTILSLVTTCSKASPAQSMPDIRGGTRKLKKKVKVLGRRGKGNRYPSNGGMSMPGKGRNGLRRLDDLQNELMSDIRGGTRKLKKKVKVLGRRGKGNRYPSNGGMSMPGKGRNGLRTLHDDPETSMAGDLQYELMPDIRGGTRKLKKRVTALGTRGKGNIYPSNGGMSMQGKGRNGFRRLQDDPETSMAGDVQYELMPDIRGGTRKLKKRVTALGKRGKGNRYPSNGGMSMPGKGRNGLRTLQDDPDTSMAGDLQNDDVKMAINGDGVDTPFTETETLTPTPQQLNDLMTFSSKFYIYDDPAIAQSQLVAKLRAFGAAAFDEDSKDLDHVVTDALSEYNVLEELKKHPLRTNNPNQADLFIVPTPITELLLFGCRWEDCLWYDEAFAALAKHPIFRMHHGQKHIILSFNWLSFNRRFQAFIPALSRNYAMLRNVTVAHHFDPFGAARLASMTKNSEYDALFPLEMPPVTNAFSVGLGLGYDIDTFPLSIPDYDSFGNKTNFLFYHTGDRDFQFGSTKYRKAIFKDADQLATLPLSHVGFAIEYNEWLTGIQSSKFCLVTRGDTPHSHSLFLAVRAGCIPVVVSDFYPDYAPPLKSSLDMRDFCILIDETIFLQEPVRSLQDLENLSPDFVRAKLMNITIAQQILLPDAEESLFVPALLREALAASGNVVPHSLPAPRPAILQDVAFVSGMKVPYRVPSTLLSEEKRSLIVGVLSMPTNSNARLAIRQTWAENRNRQVVFAVAGQWEDIEEEFHQEGDLIWLDMPEDFLLLTYKTQALFHALDRFSGPYDYIMKTDDDSYVGVDAIQDILERHSPDFWGYCMFDDVDRMPFRDPEHKYFVSNETWPQEYYPVWAQGMGYVLSQSFLQCALETFPTLKFMTMEDVSIGIVAEHCHVPCQSDEWNSWNDDENKFTKPMRVEHGIKASDEMLYKHWDQMGILKQGEFGDFD